MILLYAKKQYSFEPSQKKLESNQFFLIRSILLIDHNMIFVYYFLYTYTTQ